MRLIRVFAAIGILFAVPVHAAPILLQKDHVAYGVQDLLVDDILYDVSFSWGSYTDVFKLPPTFLVPYSPAVASGSLGKAGRATLGVTNLFNQSQIAAVGDGFGATSGLFMTPLTITPDKTILGAQADTAAQSIKYLWVTDTGAPAFATFDEVRMYAVFTEKNTVPEPGTLLMLSVGGLIAGALRRRAHQPMA